MEKRCNICGSTEKLAKKGEVCLCRTCLRVIYAVLRPKMIQLAQECDKTSDVH